jgi:hypothetical protein
MIRGRVLAICCGYVDADALCPDPAFKLACGRLPDSDHPARGRSLRLLVAALMPSVPMNGGA